MSLVSVAVPFPAVLVSVGSELLAFLGISPVWFFRPVIPVFRLLVVLQHLHERDIDALLCFFLRLPTASQLLNHLVAALLVAHLPALLHPHV